MVQSVTDTRSVQMNNINGNNNNNTTASYFPYVTYTQRKTNKSEYNTHIHQQQQRQQQQGVHANIRNGNSSYSANNTKNHSTLFPVALATTASIVGTGKTKTSRSNSHADKTQKMNSSSKMNNLTEINKSNSNAEVETISTKGLKQQEYQKEEVKRNSAEEQEQYHVSRTTSNTEIDWLRRITLQRQRDKMDKAHHLQFLKLCGKIGPKPWRHSTVAEQKDMCAMGNENNQQQKSNSNECKEELSSLMSCDGVCSPPSSLSSSLSSSAFLLPLCNTNKINSNKNNCKKKEKKKKKTNCCCNNNNNKCKDEHVSKKKLADVDATDEDVYELVYGVGTCGYLQQLTQRAQRQALPSTNYDYTTSNINNEEESDYNTNNATTTVISANKQDKPLPTIQGDNGKKTSVFDRLRYGNNNRNTYMILNAGNTNNTKREQTLPPLTLSRADHPLSMQPTPQGTSTTSESTLGPTSSVSPESSSSLMHEASMYVAPSTHSRSSLSSAIVGGQMDVFGYFATHRVFPHYYDTLQTRFYSTRIA